MDFVISSSQILGMCTLIASIWGVVKIVQEIKKPSEDLKALIKKHDELLKQDNDRLKRLEELQQQTTLYLQKDIIKQLDEQEEMLIEHKAKIEENEQSNKMILKSLFVIINHDITKNGFDKLKETRDELQKFLVDK